MGIYNKATAKYHIRHGLLLYMFVYCGTIGLNVVIIITNYDVIIVVTDDKLK